MAKFGSDVIKFTVSSASGTTVTHNLANYIDTINGFKLNSMLQESHAFGDAWVENLYTGIKSADDVTVGGFFDDVAASGPHALMGQTSDLGAERNCEIDFTGTSDIVAFKYLLASYQRSPVRGELTRFEAVLKVSGAVTTAT